MSNPSVRTFVLDVVNRALAGADSLDPKNRADLYEGVGIVLEKFHGMTRRATAAKAAAHAIREAEQHQLKFSLLLAEEEEA